MDSLQNHDMSALALLSIECQKSGAELVEDHATILGLTPLHRVLFGLQLYHLSFEEYLSCLPPQILADVIDLPDAHGRSTLACAVEYRCYNAVETLTKYKANVNQQRLGDRGCLSLLHIVFAGPSQQINADIARVLIKAGAIVDVRDSDGWTPLLIAASWMDYTGIKVLLDANAELTAETHDGDDVVKLSGDPEIMEKLKTLVFKNTHALI